MGQLLRILIAAVFVFNIYSANSVAEPKDFAQTTDVTQQVLLARSLQHSGRYDSALAVLQKALLTKPNSALLLNQLGSLQQDLGQYLEAESSYLRALAPSAQLEGRLESVVIRINLATLYLDTGQYAKGEQLREQLVKAAPTLIDADPTSAAGLLNVIGSLEHVRNRNDEAERYYSHSLTLFRQAKGAISSDAALVEANMGFLKLQARHYDSAADLFRQAIREIEIALDSENPALIRPLICLATCENLRGASIPAELAARRAVRLSRQVFGEGHPVTATAMLQQATALRALKHKRQAHKLERIANAWLQNNSKSNSSGYTVELGALAHSTAR